MRPSHQWRRVNGLVWRCPHHPICPGRATFRSGGRFKRDIEMKICVLGAGVIGLTTAWRLAEAGHDVIVVDRNVTTGADASAANGGQLSYAFVAPLASPALLMKL